jgi:hypothetical protein
MELLTFKQGLFLGIVIGFFIGVMITTILMRDY